MGKYVLLVVMSAAGLWGLTMVSLQSDQRSNENEAEYQRKTLARQVARTGLNVMRSKVSQTDEECPKDIVNSVSEIEGEHQGEMDHGRYEAWVDSVPIDLSYRIVSVGTFQNETDTLRRLERVNTTAGGLMYVQKEELIEGVGPDLDLDLDAGDSDVDASMGPGRIKQYPEQQGSDFKTSPHVKATGPYEMDLDGDGRKEIPYLRKANKKIEIMDTDGEKKILVNANRNGDKEPLEKKTRLGVGVWGGSDPSVFYVNSSKDAIYQASWEGNGKNNRSDPERIAELSNSRNGAQAVVGVADVNDDAGDELVFVDGSQQLRYIDEPGEPDEGNEFTKIQNGGVGATDGIEVESGLLETDAEVDLQNLFRGGIGAGEMVDINGDGTSSVVFVNGSNNIRVVNDAGTDRTIKVDNINGGSGPGALKVPPTVTDVDADGNLEVAYIVNDGPTDVDLLEDTLPNFKVKYVDVNPENPESPSVGEIEDISVDPSPGLQSTDTVSPCSGSEGGG